MPSTLAAFRLPDRSLTIALNERVVPCGKRGDIVEDAVGRIIVGTDGSVRAVVHAYGKGDLGEDLRG